jgi:hypothetical protein
MRRTAFVLLVFASLGPGGARPVGAQAPDTAQAASAAPTFNADVAPILYANCVTCHRPGEVAPMSLMTFVDARPWARAMKARVTAGEMPPWAADPKYGDFKNKPTITTAQASVIAAWADAGAPEGDGAAPAAPVFQEGAWSTQIGRPPDQIIDAPFEFDVPASGEVPTFTIWVKIPFRDDRFVEAMQLRPTNPRVVHHSSISLGDLPPKTKLGKAPVWDGGPALDGVPLFGDGRPYRAMSGDEFGYPLLFYVPGGGLLRFPEGIAKRLTAGKYLSWGMHYVTDGKPEKVRMRLALWFAKKTVTHQADTWTANDRKFVGGRDVTKAVPNIPPYTDNFEIVGTVTFPDDVTLYSMWPHMHWRGKDMTFVLVRPNGKEETLLSVPKYNPNWQTTYELVKPMKIPARSTIRAIAHYDNSVKNPRNPAPDQEVKWGPQSINEMFLPFLEVSVDKDDLRFQDR